MGFALYTQLLRDKYGPALLYKPTSGGATSELVCGGLDGSCIMDPHPELPCVLPHIHLFLLIIVALYHGMNGSYRSPLVRGLIHDVHHKEREREREREREKIEIKILVPVKHLKTFIISLVFDVSRF